LFFCRYNGWVTELKDQTKVMNVSEASGIDNLLYSSDVDFSCFADLAVVSPVDYRKEGEGSLMQVVITPCEKYMPMTNEQIAAEMHKQVQQLFPSARELASTWHSVVKIQQSLYRCAQQM
jgi:zeta-carotene desaturase